MKSVIKLSEWLKDPQGLAAWFNTDSDFLNSINSLDNQGVEFNHSIGNPAQFFVGYEQYIPELKCNRQIIAESDDLQVRRIFMNTPMGEKGWELAVKKTSIAERLADAAKSPVSGEEDFTLFNWYLELIRNNDWSACKAAWKNMADRHGASADLALFLCPPSELLHWTRRQDIFYLCSDYPEQYQQAMDRILDAYEIILSMAAECGIRIVTYGAPGGTEFTSPTFWEEFIIPSSIRLEKMCRSAGLYTVFHCCGKITTIIEKGFINQIAPSVYETAAPPPVGDVTDLARIRKLIDPKIVIHGNLDLSLLRNAPVEEVKKAAAAIVEAAGGLPHLLGASDACLWPGTPVETLRELCRMYNL